MVKLVQPFHARRRLRPLFSYTSPVSARCCSPWQTAHGGYHRTTGCRDPLHRRESSFVADGYPITFDHSSVVTRALLKAEGTLHPPRWAGGPARQLSGSQHPFFPAPGPLSTSWGLVEIRNPGSAPPYSLPTPFGRRRLVPPLRGQGPSERP